MASRPTADFRAEAVRMALTTGLPLTCSPEMSPFLG